MQRIFLGFVAFCATLGAAIGVFLFVSAIPYIGLIGKVVAGLLIVGLICAAGLVIVWTISTASILLSRRRRERNHRNVIVAGEVVSYHDDDGTWVHLSSIHEAAKVQQVKALPEPSPSWQAVLDLRKDGKGMHQIAKDLKVPYNKVRDFLNSVEKDESAT